MKKFLLFSCMGIIGVQTMMGTVESYINDGISTADPVGNSPIDAINFINNGQFIRTNAFFTSPYRTFNTLNFSNRNVMIAKPGFRFDTSPSGAGTNRMAANFVNANLINPGNARIQSDAYLSVWSSNIVNRGMLSVSTNGVLTLKGENLDLAGGVAAVSGYRVNTNIGTFFSGNGFQNDWGIFDDYWLAGTNTMQYLFVDPYTDANLEASFFDPDRPIETANHDVEYLDANSGGYLDFSRRISMTNQPNTTFLTMMSDYTFSKLNVADANSNYTATTVYLMHSNNPAAPVDVDVRFDWWLRGGDNFRWGVPAIRWTAKSTNRLTGTITTNKLYLWDFLGRDEFPGLQEHFSTNTMSPKSTFMPDTYVLFRELKETSTRRFEDLDVGLPFDSSIYFGSYNSGNTIHEAAYRARLEPSTHLVYTNFSGASMSNMLGRTEITAGQKLDLTRAKLDCMNYLSVQSTNHYVGSPGAQIIAPFSDINLASTNGSLVITNFLMQMPRMRGEISVWSARFFVDRVTLFDPALGIFTPPTNRIYHHVLFVDSRLEPDSAPMIKDLTLRSTNPIAGPTGNDHVIIGDQLNVKNNLLIDADRLTLTKTIVNNAGVLSTNGMGELNLVDPVILWSNSLPRLKSLTNYGKITAVNATYFGGSRRQPYYNNEFDEPYEAFINRGFVETEANRVWANAFESSGYMLARSGPMNVSANSALITGTSISNGVFSATNSDISISSGLCVISNSSVAAGRKLVLSVTNQLTDGGTNWPNFWSSGDGVDLLIKPVVGDLLGTSLTNKAVEFANIISTWTASDFGADKAGYSNNVAMGRLVLDGGFGSIFTFQGTGGGQAMYVDKLELLNHTTNYLEAFNFTNGVANPITLYFADAVANGTSIADKLNNTHGGRLKWVQNFAGPLSSVAVTLRNGDVIQVNGALFSSSIIDSDADGLANGADTFPFDGPSMVPSLNPVSPNKTVTISWNAAPSTAYVVESSTNLLSWQFITNVTSGPVPAVMSIEDQAPSGVQRFYRVRYSP